MSNCKHLFNLFERSGGKLECDYETKSCFLEQRENILNCDLKSVHKFDLESFVVDSAFGSSAKFQHVSGNANEKLHSLHFEGTKGFVVVKK
jgi:hypothetical protein